MDDLRHIVETTARRADVADAVAEVYAELATEIARRRPLCVVSGRCCRFEEYGHRLYVTTLELAAFYRDAFDAPPALPVACDGTGCPFQRNKLCSVHTSRPFGCRIYFCDPSSQAWQQELYERLHDRLRRLHEQLEVPYRYVEWRSALRELGLARPGESL